MGFLENILRQLGDLGNEPALGFVHDHHLTGRELGARVSDGRSFLRSRGLAVGDRVVVLCKNSPAWVAIDLAIMAEGGIPVPLYTRQSLDELSFILRDSEPKLVLADSESLESPLRGAGKTEWVDVNAIFAGGAPLVSAPPRPRADEDTVTIVYTSGTSGEPKGVMLTSSNVEFMLQATSDALDSLLGPARLESRHRVFHYLPFCFAGSRILLWTSLLRRSLLTLSSDSSQLMKELKVAAPHYVLNVPLVLERIRRGVEERLLEKWIVRALYEASSRAYERALAGQGRRADALLLHLAKGTLWKSIRRGIVGPTLECLISGSAPLREETQRWFEMLGLPVYQVYGLTETTAIVAMDQPGRVAPGRVGLPVAKCAIRLGRDGELLVKGPNVFRGYWNRAEASAAAFQDGWFRTGDRAEIDGEGRLRILGRVNEMIVPESGHNILPRELEQKLLDLMPRANHVVVIGHGRPFLTAIVSGAVPDDEARQSIAQLNEELPHYQRIRGFFCTREAFTVENRFLTANQKVRRKAIESHFAKAIEGLYRAQRPRSRSMISVANTS